MKSYLVIGAMCFMFIIISGFTGEPKATNTHFNLMQCSHIESNGKSPLIIERKKLKTSQMPSWQRVIPGMFR